MASTMHPPSTATSTVEEVLETAQTTSKECTNTSQRLGAEAHKLLPINSALTLVCDRLESVIDDEEVTERLESIVIGGDDKSCRFLVGLSSDLRSISAYLRNIGRTLGRDLTKDEVNMYAEALSHYSRVLKTVEKRNAKCVKVILLSDTL
jgi:tRNA isopentenyl-2-thiomethyl-A-37 hydroxylase MiaE